MGLVPERDDEEAGAQAPFERGELLTRFQGRYSRVLPQCLHHPTDSRSEPINQRSPGGCRCLRLRMT